MCMKSEIGIEVELKCVSWSSLTIKSRCIYEYRIRGLIEQRSKANCGFAVQFSFVFIRFSSSNCFPLIYSLIRLRFARIMILSLKQDRIDPMRIMHFAIGMAVWFCAYLWCVCCRTHRFALRQQSIGWAFELIKSSQRCDQCRLLDTLAFCSFSASFSFSLFYASHLPLITSSLPIRIPATNGNPYTYAIHSNNNIQLNAIYCNRLFAVCQCDNTVHTDKQYFEK